VTARALIVEFIVSIPEMLALGALLMAIAFLALA
jgi:hypothetical protein